jgi:hypothetical protein
MRQCANNWSRARGRMTVEAFGEQGRDRRLAGRDLQRRVFGTAPG